MKKRPKRLRVAVLDDYLNVSSSMADWSSLSEQCDIDVYNTHLSLSEAKTTLMPYDVVCHMRERMAMPGELIHALPNLKLIGITSRRHRTLDLRAAAERGITICHSTRPLVGQYAAPELAWGLVLAATKNIAFEDRQMRLGGWQNRLGVTLYGKTLGLIGFGFVGQQMCQFGKAFGMDVVTWSQNLSPQVAESAGARYVSKEELFASSDVVSIHLVLGGRTRGIVGRKELGWMKKTAYLINTSRGPLIDEPALVDALRNRSIAGAGLDVFEIEPLPDKHELRQMDNVVITPHIGFNTPEVLRVFYKDTIDVIRRYIDGVPINVVGSDEDWG